MAYYKDLKLDDFESYPSYWSARVLRGLDAGFTLHQCELHRLIDLALDLGLSQTDILTIVGPDTGYSFPCVPTSTST